jgi:glucans biosynthesis protein
MLYLPSTTNQSHSILNNFPGAVYTEGSEMLRVWPSKSRAHLFSWVFLLVLILPASAQPKQPFEYNDVVEKAKLLAGKPFEAPEKIPDFLLKLDYDQWREIRFRPEKALWREQKLPFQVEFFHPGFLYNRKVIINVVGPGGVEEVPFSPDLFHYGMNDFKGKVPAHLGFSGFRLHYELNTPNYYDEFAVFLGASYFRMIGEKEVYGLSARGLAIDTALQSGEEFPYFREFWLVQPQPSAKSISVYALLDSPSATGAYEFGIQPGEATLTNIATTLFLRKEVKKLGMAPLNSMFFYGENTSIRPVDDFRPEVHDSDGLLIATGTGEWIWRPLLDPKTLLVTSFQLSSPGGFGLLQRDRNFDHYQDLEAHYEMRPSAWVTPKNDWGKGRVELVMIPMDTEKNDNIVAYWVPAASAEIGKPMSFSYEIRWGAPEIPNGPSDRVVATRTAVGKKEGTKLYVVDFDGKVLQALPADSDVKADIGVGGGELVEHHLEKNSVTGGWRLVFYVRRKEGTLSRVIPGTNQPLELRAFLRQGNKVLTETWSYVDPLF